METSAEINEIAAALALAQPNINGAVKDSTNPHFKNKYADLSSVMDACKDALNNQGISVLQINEPSDPGFIRIRTVLLHKSGQFISGSLVMPAPKTDPQGYGSAQTYARRYALSAMVGVCPEDDDGNAAMPEKAKPLDMKALAAEVAKLPASDLEARWFKLGISKSHPNYQQAATIFQARKHELDGAAKEAAA